MTNHSFRLVANVVDVVQRQVSPAEVTVENGRITAIRPTSETPTTYLTPGFVDAHVHVESSLLVPAEFARAAVVHGTVATVSDPHEIANVLGIDGIRYMLASAAQTPLKIHFGASSCVPATPFETAGAKLGPAEVAALLAEEQIGYLAEMMNYPGVIRGDAEVLSKIATAIKVGKPVDGHAPQVRGADAQAYFAAGISTDHECVTLDEAREKLSLGVKILIREGSAARNFDALCDLLREHSDRCMFCSDDLHPDSLVAGHIDRLLRRAVSAGIDPLNALRCASLNPIEHYQLPVGLLRVGDTADFVEIDNLVNFRVLRTFIDGQLVAESGRPHLPSLPCTVVNRFAKTIRQANAYRVPATSKRMRVIEAFDGELITHSLIEPPLIEKGCAIPDRTRDLLKLVVVNRYQAAPPAIAFIRGFGLQRGAIASSVAHDSHNIVAVGVDDESLAAAINSIMEAGGGLAVIDGSDHDLLPLPVGGLMSNKPYEMVADDYSRLDRKAKQLGSLLRAPFMTLSFMALLVIPQLKLSDLGLFDCQRGELTPLFL
ncbi:adenine deaminase [Anatilimnocola sp. NA78]|uniref:adenine deaminase n=1 Tax=Anatilimnocola sp. NA78 TaxID=3415683 RepID=UPI003CE4A6FB